MCQKGKHGLLSVAWIWVSWFWEGPGRQTLDTRSTSGVPLTKFGYDGSNEAGFGRSLASKLSAKCFTTFSASLHGYRWKSDFLEDCSVAANFHFENLLGLVPMDSINALFLPLFDRFEIRRSLGREGHHYLKPCRNHLHCCINSETEISTPFQLYGFTHRPEKSIPIVEWPKPRFPGVGGCMWCDWWPFYPNTGRFQNVYT